MPVTLDSNSPISAISKSSIEFMNSYGFGGGIVIGDSKGKPKALVLGNKGYSDLFNSLNDKERERLKKQTVSAGR